MMQEYKENSKKECNEKYEERLQDKGKVKEEYRDNADISDLFETEIIWDESGFTSGAGIAKRK